MATTGNPDEVAALEQLLLARLRTAFSGQKWIVAGGVAQGQTGGAKRLESMGAASAIALATRLGTGPLDEHAHLLVCDDAQVPPTASMVERMHDDNRQLHDAPPWVLAAVDEWDPDRQARVIVDFTMDGGTVANRPCFGARRENWKALEDKIAIRSLWRSAGIATAADDVVEVADQDALVQAHRALAGERGTVWAVDNQQGWHGGAKGTHWVADESQIPALAATLSQRHRKVRVQPFLDGVPCSMHGFALASGTAALRPCETIMLLDPMEHRFVYSRTATYWDPEPAHTAAMRNTVRAVGDELRRTFNYRGVFTVDGVLTERGFLPTEVNPRFGAALPGTIVTGDGQVLPLFFTHLIGVEGLLDDIDPAALERTLVARLREKRDGGLLIFTSEDPGEQERSVHLTGRWQDGAMTDLAPTELESEAFLTAHWGHEPSGGLVLARFSSAMPTGALVAPTVVAVRSFLGSYWDLDLANLIPAATVPSANPPQVQ